MRRLGLAVALTLIGGVSACGNPVEVTASDVARSYVSELGDGGFLSACGMLAPGARRELEASARMPCAKVFAHCLPHSATSLSQDQAQLFYVNADPLVIGGETQVSLSGPTVAREIKAVTLLKVRGRWLLTGPGAEIARCARAAGRAGHHKAKTRRAR